MNNEKQKILDMLEKGTITPADAAKLLECCLLYTSPSPRDA